VLTLLVGIGNGFALSNSNLGAILGAVTIDIQNESGVVDVGDKAIFVKPVLVAGLLTSLALPLDDSCVQFKRT